MNLVMADVNATRSVSVKIIPLRASTTLRPNCRVGKDYANSARIFGNWLVANLHIASTYFSSGSTLQIYLSINNRLPSKACCSAGKGEETMGASTSTLNNLTALTLSSMYRPVIRSEDKLNPSFRKFQASSLSPSLSPEKWLSRKPASLSVP